MILDQRRFDHSSNIHSTFYYSNNIKAFSHSNMEIQKNFNILIQSNLYTTATLGTPKKRPLFRGGRYSEFSPIKLQLVCDVWGSGWPLLTGGRCSEVAVNTGLTIHSFVLKFKDSYNKAFDRLDIRKFEQIKTFEH
jgi:hypothetical protein